MRMPTRGTPQKDCGEQAAIGEQTDGQSNGWQWQEWQVCPRHAVPTAGDGSSTPEAGDAYLTARAGSGDANCKELCTVPEHCCKSFGPRARLMKKPWPGCVETLVGLGWLELAGK